MKVTVTKNDSYHSSSSSSSLEASPSHKRGDDTEGVDDNDLERDDDYLSYEDINFVLSLFYYMMIGIDILYIGVHKLERGVYRLRGVVEYLYESFLLGAVTPDGKVSRTYKNEGRYKGEVNAKGERDGEGTMIFYEGASRKDKRQITNISVYEGHFVNDKENGSGKMTYTNGDVYDGTWVDGKREGRGMLTLKENEEKYEGEFKDGKVEGTGKKSFADGSVYEGQFVENKMQGRGKMIYPSEEIYEGEWKEDERHGKGQMAYKDGGKYEGDWVNNLRDGHGVLTHSNQNETSYNGGFRKDKRHGEGKTKFINGARYEGTYENGKRNGHGKYTFSDSLDFRPHYYKGGWKDDIIEGEGTYQYRGGDFYEGFFKNGLRHGEGRMEFESRVVYEGQWSQGKMDGNGKIDLQDCTPDAQKSFRKIIGDQRSSCIYYLVACKKGSIMSMVACKKGSIIRHDSKPPYRSSSHPTFIYDIFLSHTWAADEDGRDNHQRVERIHKALKKRGINSWFDGEKMRANMLRCMSRGIESSLTVAVFVTKKYLNKVDSEGNDNCKFEFEHAMRHMTVENMIPVVMEHDIPSPWKGSVGLTLGSHLYISFKDDDEFDECVNKIEQEIKERRESQ